MGSRGRFPFSCSERKLPGGIANSPWEGEEGPSKIELPSKCLVVSAKFRMIYVVHLTSLFRCPTGDRRNAASSCPAMQSLLRTLPTRFRRLPTSGCRTVRVHGRLAAERLVRCASESQWSVVARLHTRPLARVRLAFAWIDRRKETFRASARPTTGRLVGLGAGA